MNKKFSTLMASLLLAGGALSNLSAENINDLADGTYYKIVRTAYKYQGDGESATGYPDSEGKFFLGKGVLTSNVNEDILWKVVKNVDGTISLFNLNNDEFTVDGVNDFTVDYRDGSTNKFAELSSVESNLFKSADKYLANQASSSDNTNYALLLKEDGKNAWVEASLDGFDAEATNLQEVGGSDFTATEFFDPDGETYVADGKTYRIVFSDNGVTKYIDRTILKAAYNKDRKVWTFTYNTTAGGEFEFDGEADFEMVQVGDDAVLKLKSGKGYVAVENGDFKLVDSIEEATILAFDATNTRVPVTVGVLNYYEQDGFSVEITCAKDTDGKFDDELAGNPFVGHLTPMTFDWTEMGGNDKEGKFVAADENAKEFYLKNADGKYIVAVPYDVETASSYESLYNFVTVTEDELIHNLKRAWNDQLNDAQELFGRFRLSVDEAQWAQDATKIDEITWLEVNVAHYSNVATDAYATVGRADIKGVPTLVASSSTSLKDILITLGSGQVVDWKELLQPKFFTVEKYNAAGTTLEGKLTATGYSTTDWRSSYGNDLEGQFALTIDGDYYKFTNRETRSSVWEMIPVRALYYTDKEYTYKWGNNIYVIKPVAEVNEADGYVRFSDSQLNRQYHIAFSSGVFGSQAYLAENHDDANDAQQHVVGLLTDKEDALVFNIKKYNAARDLKDEQEDHTYDFHPTDSIYVVSKLGFYNTKTKQQDYTLDTLKVVTYSFVNQYVEPLMYGPVSTAEGYAYYSDVYKTDAEKVKYANESEAHAVAQKFAIRMDNEKYNLRPVKLCKEAFNETKYGVNKEYDSRDLYQVFDWEASHNDWYKMYAGDATLGILNNADLYDRTENDLFVIEETESEVYRRLANNVDTVSIYRNYNEKSLLYEKTTEIADDVFVNFLGMENIADFTKMAPAMIADTAYVRNETYKPQYMLIVDPTIHPAGKWCEEHQSSTCEHAVDVPAWTEGRFLVNLVDSAKAWDNANKHQVGNPFKNSEGKYKLGFVPAIHRNDSLIVNGKRQFIGNNDNHIAKFQFRYADTADQSFVIETSLDGTQTPGYLKWMNGVVVVVDDIKNADIYNMNEDESRTPTANETIAAGNVVVAGVNGAVVVKGAEGKNVIVSTILGKVVANEVVSSDNAQISVPAGIVVVSVDGESFKVVVK